MFGLADVKFLRRIVTADGIKVDPIIIVQFKIARYRYALRKCTLFLDLLHTIVALLKTSIKYRRH